MVLLGDIGGTNARFSLLRGGELSPITTVPVAKHPDVDTAITKFLKLHDNLHIPDTSALLGLAGPVESNRCVLTNSSWMIDAQALKNRFGFADVRLLNDFEAVAWSLPHLDPSDIRMIGGGQPMPESPMAVLGPGTGLGLSYFLSVSGRGTAVATEGGHVTVAATSPREFEVVEHLKARFGHVSAERVLSGGGLENLYDAIRIIDGAEAPQRTAAEITEHAVSASCAVSVEVLDMFCAMLGTVAGNVALTLGARGGVFIAGGIAPRLVDYLSRSQFRQRFEAKGRFRTYMSMIPTKVIIHPDPAFIGLKALAREDLGIADTLACNDISASQANS